MLINTQTLHNSNINIKSKRVSANHHTLRETHNDVTLTHLDFRHAYMCIIECLCLIVNIIV